MSQISAEEQAAWMQLFALTGPVPARIKDWQAEVERRWETMQERYRVDPSVRFVGKHYAVESVTHDVARGVL